MISSLPGEETYVRARVHRGGVMFETYSTNRMTGDPSSLGSRTIAQVLAGDVPTLVPPDLLAEIQDEVRDRPPDDGPNALAPDGYTRLGRAVIDGDRAEVTRLIAAGADLDDDGAHFLDTPLMLALRGRRVEIMQELLAAGADPSKVDLEHGFGGLPGPHLAFIKPLVDAGAPVTGGVIVKAVNYKDRECLELFYAKKPYVRTALKKLIAAVRSIGEANDAIDHGARESADEMYASAPEKVRHAWLISPVELGQMFRHLEMTMSEGKFDTSRWYELVEQFEAVL